MHRILEQNEIFTTDCKTCTELLKLLREVKSLMDSEVYVDDYDSIYDKIVNTLKKYT